MSKTFKQFNKLFDEFVENTANVVRSDNNIKEYRIKDKIKTQKIAEFSSVIEIPRYGIFIEKGRRKGAKMPPHDPIKKWAIEKKIINSSDKRADSITFLIRRSISENGIKPKPFIFDNVNDSLDAFLKSDAIANAIAIDISNNLNDLF